LKNLIWGAIVFFMPEKAESDFIYEQAVNSALII